MLEIERVDTFYGETQALFGASLSVRQGEAVALLGPNGAGKTTTLLMVLGVVSPDAGSVAVDHGETAVDEQDDPGPVPHRRIVAVPGHAGPNNRAMVTFLPVPTSPRNRTNAVTS